ncbi:hypothetical protein D3C81_1894500 [compost metagenome]
MHFIEAAAEILFRNITELESRQRADRFTQRTQEKLALQTVAVSRCAIQVVADNVEIDLILYRNRRFLPGQIQCHTFWHEIFDVEIP